ncbi:MAG TPA: hypothetical protein DCS48_14220, partial [Desulfovibrio sp.]|nr:hypothetical protein [Desulfovibrio sp.]
MKMTKKMRTALTVAVIAGTCALSSPSFAAWTSDAPSKLAANITAGVVGESNNEGMVIVGSEGKIYYMDDSTMKGNDPQWSKRTTSVSGDFADVVYETTDLGIYWAITTAGELVYSQDGSTWSVLPIRDPAKTALSGKTVVGLAACGTGSPGGSDTVIVTQDGVVVYYDASNSEWKVTATILASGSIARAGVTGVKDLPGEFGKVVVFGKGGGSGNANNMYRVTLGEDNVVGFNVENCPDINDVVINSKNDWYAVGDAAAVVKGTRDLSGVAGNIKTAKLELKQGDGSTAYTDPTNLLSIEYDNTKKVGYISGADGKLFSLSDEKIVEKSSGVSQALNDVNLIINGSTNRVFVSGDDGVSIYGSDSAWSGIGNTAGLPSSSINGKVVSHGSTFYFASKEDNKLYSSTSPNSAWTEASLAPANNAAPYDGFNYIKPAVGTTSGGETYIAMWSKAGSSYFTTIYKAGEATNAPITVPTANSEPAYAVANFNDELALFLIGNNELLARDMTDTSAGFTSAGTLASGVYALASSGNGLYAVDRNSNFTVKARVTDSVSDKHLNIDRSNTSAEWESVKAVYEELQRISETASTLYPVSGGVVLVTNKGKLLLITDQADADVSSNEVQAINLNLSVSGVNRAYHIKGISGSKDDLTVVVADTGGPDAPEVWRYSGGSWEQYKNFKTESLIRDPKAIATVGAKSVVFGTTGASDPDLAYSAGNTFNVATPSGALPVGTKINSVFNATKCEIYVAGQDGLLYNGTLKEGASSIVWKEKRYKDSFFGSKDIFRVTGAGDKVFAIYDDANDRIAMKDLTATEWTEVIRNSNSVNTLYDVQALDESTLFFLSSSLGLTKGTISGGKISYTQQENSGPVPVPTSLIALSIVDAETIYAVSPDNLYKYDSPLGDSWTIENISLTDKQPLEDVFALTADKVYAVGSSGYAVKYDGSTATNLPTITGNPNLTSCWASEDFLYATDDAGKVHTYNVETNSWTVETLKDGTALADISGSVGGKYILAVGADTTSYLNRLSTDGGATDSSVSPESNDTAVVAAEPPVKRTPEVLAETYGTPPEMAVVSEVQKFTTTGGVTSGSTHTFNFTFTPTEDYAFNDVILYKLKADGSNLTYNRLGAAPATPTSGDFWITTAGGGSVAPGDTLTTGTPYSVHFALADGSQYDDDSVDGKITDPTVLGTSSGSGSSGCVFNPAQTFGMEWLMLAFAPVAAFFRSR